MTATQSTQPAERSFADRLLRILDVFDVGRSRMPLSEISRRSGLPLATTHRMVAKLAAWGALERGDDGLYHIGLRLWEVAMLAPRGLGLREAAMPFLEDLYEATHENVHLAVLDGTDTVYIERIFGRSAVGVLSRPGARWPLHATGVGRSVFALGSNEEAAFFAGVRVKRIKFWLFVASGLFASLASLIYTFRYASARADNGVGLELAVVAAVLLGGVSIFGGRGTLPGVLVAVLLLGVVRNALILADVANEVLNFVTGLLLVASVLAPNLGAVWRRRFSQPVHLEGKSPR